MITGEVLLNQANGLCGLCMDNWAIITCFIFIMNIVLHMLFNIYSQHFDNLVSHLVIAEDALLNQGSGLYIYAIGQ